MRYLAFWAPLAVVLLSPTISFAQEGLVACSGLDCGTCEFVETMHRVWGFLITIASIIATIALVYAGLRLTTSGGSVEAKRWTKDALTYIVVGFIFIIGAYAIVNAIMSVLLRTDISMLPWDEVECIYAIVPTGAVQNIGTRGLGDYGLSADLPPVSEQALCNSDYLGTYFPGQEEVAQCVLQGESACGAYFYSTTDINRTADGERIPFSVSPWQINLTTHEIRAGECTSGPIDCKSAYSGTNYFGVLVDREIYDQCVEALKDPDCSGAVAQRIYEEAGNWSPWSAYRRNSCGG